MKAAPSETQQAGTPPAEAAKEEPAPPAQSPVEAATTGHAPEGQAAGEQEPAAEQEQPAQEQPAGEGEQAQNAPEAPAEGSAAPVADDLPVADSLTSDARVYRIWLYESGQEGDARSYWNKLTMQYPGLLKKLDLDVRRYFLGDAKGSLYRVFAGPFENLGDAQKACEDIRTRFGDQFCRPVLN